MSQATLHRWLRLSDFRAAYRHARRELVEEAIGGSAELGRYELNRLRLV